MRKRTQARESALQILYQVEMNPGLSPREHMDLYWNNNQITDEEVRQFSERIVTGTLEYLKEIDAIILKATENWELNRMAVIDHNILRFAAYELLFLGDIPPKVTINEAVNIAKRFSQEESGKFVNGVLDRITHTEKSRAAGPHDDSKKKI